MASLAERGEISMQMRAVDSRRLGGAGFDELPEEREWLGADRTPETMGEADQEPEREGNAGLGVIDGLDDAGGARVEPFEGERHVEETGAGAAMEILAQEEAVWSLDFTHVDFGFGLPAFHLEERGELFGDEERAGAGTVDAEDAWIPPGPVGRAGEEGPDFIPGGFDVDGFPKFQSPVSGKRTGRKVKLKAL